MKEAPFRGRSHAIFCVLSLIDVELRMLIAANVVVHGLGTLRRTLAIFPTKQGFQQTVECADYTAPIGIAYRDTKCCLCDLGKKHHTFTKNTFFPLSPRWTCSDLRRELSSDSKPLNFSTNSTRQRNSFACSSFAVLRDFLWLETYIARACHVVSCLVLWERIFRSEAITER